MCSWEKFFQPFHIIFFTLTNNSFIIILYFIFNIYFVFVFFLINLYINFSYVYMRILYVYDILFFNFIFKFILFFLLIYSFPNLQPNFSFQSAFYFNLDFSVIGCGFFAFLLNIDFYFPETWWSRC